MSPISVTTTAAPGIAYTDVRMGGGHSIHQVLLDVSDLAASADANGTLPPGFPIRTNGDPVTGGADALEGVIGPEAVTLGSADHFGNVIRSGDLNKNAIEDNLGRVLSANELAAIALIGAIRLK